MRFLARGVASTHLARSSRVHLLLRGAAHHLGASVSSPFRVMLCIAALAFVIRLALVFHVQPYPERFMTSDAIGYNQLAINLIRGNGFSMQDSPPYEPDNFRTPGYPLFVALMYLLSGCSPASVLIAQAVLSTATCLLTYKLGQTLMNDQVGLWAAGLMAVSAISITYAALLWSDTLYSFLLTLSILLLAKAYRTQSTLTIGAGGMCLGAATLVHPRSLYLAPLLALAILLGNAQGRWRATWFGGGGVSASLVFVLVFIASVSPWYYRNHQVFGKAHYTSAAEFNMLFYWAALLEVDRNGGNQWEIARRYEDEARQRLPAHCTPTAADLSRTYGELAVEKIQQHPLSYAQVHLEGATRVFLPGTLAIQNLLAGDQLDSSGVYAFITIGSSTEALWRSFWQSLRPNTIVAILLDAGLLAIVYISAALGVWAKRREAWMYAALGIVVYLAMVVGPAGSPRFRLAFTPVLCVLAGIGIVRIMGHGRPGREGGALRSAAPRESSSFWTKRRP